MPGTPRFAFALDYVTDIEAAKRFYVDVLGLEVEREHPTFVQFASFAIAGDEPAGGGETELYWAVEDAEAAFREMSQHAEVVAPLAEQPFGKVFAVKDLDGHPRHLIEFARERPSQEVA
ncbi:MAG: hypothetical protein GEU80_02930 [Dehalococcoidia bacterium]|nr:hypothetical protein [Dehalococcoidia bacterium]